MRAPRCRAWSAPAARCVPPQAVCARHAELGQRDHGAALGCEALCGAQRGLVVCLACRRVERIERACRPMQCAAARRRETPAASTPAWAQKSPPARRCRLGAHPRCSLVDHRLVGLEHRHRREPLLDRVDAGAEGRAGEEDRLGAGGRPRSRRAREARASSRRRAAPLRARSADRLSSSRFMRCASGQSRSSASLIGATECASAWISAMRGVRLETLTPRRRPESRDARHALPMCHHTSAASSAPGDKHPVRRRARRVRQLQLDDLEALLDAELLRAAAELDGGDLEVAAELRQRDAGVARAARGRSRLRPSASRRSWSASSPSTLSPCDDHHQPVVLGAARRRP